MHDDMELMAAIGHMVVNAAELEYAIAELAATAGGLRDEECRERATAIVQKPGEAKRQFERLVQERPDLDWLICDTVGLLGRGTSSRTPYLSKTLSPKAIPPCSYCLRDSVSPQDWSTPQDWGPHRRQK